MFTKFISVYFESYKFKSFQKRCASDTSWYQLLENYDTKDINWC